MYHQMGREDLESDNSDSKGGRSQPRLFLLALEGRAWWTEGGRVAAHLARETRMRQPPENFCVGRFCISGSKPRPARIRLALASAAAAPVARNSSYTWEEGEEDTCPKVPGPPSLSPCPLRHLLYLLQPLSSSVIPLLQQALKPSLLFQQLQSLGVGSENSLHSWRLIRHDLWT